METSRKGELGKTVKVSRIFLLLLVLLKITTPSSAQNSTTVPAQNSTTASAPSPAALSYRTRPANLTVAVGELAEFRCGVPKASPNLTFTIYGSHRNYSLTCPDGHLEDIPQALYGSCDMTEEESLAVWTLKGTSFSDNGARFICQQSNNPDAATAVLLVYDDGTSYATLIGCAIGGFFGMLLVAGLSFLMLRRSETLQKCFWGGETEDDLNTMVTKE